MRGVLVLLLVVTVIAAIAPGVQRQPAESAPSVAASQRSLAHTSR